MNSSADVTSEVPPGDVTVMSTAPADSAGATACISVDEITVKEVASVLPKNT